jgi:hypothetical protein
VALSAQRLVVVKSGAFWPGKRVHVDCVDYPPAVQPLPWQSAVAALAQWLESKGGKKPALHIVLSGRFVRWQLLPWRPELTQPDELAAYAALRFRETFGPVAGDWQVVLSPQPPGKAVLACAVDTALMAALRTTCESAGARLAAVTPDFATAFDRWRHVLDKKAAWFGLVEPDGVTLGLLRDGHWLGLRTQRVNAHWREVLPGLMTQIGIAAGVAETALPLYLVGEGAPPAPVAGLAVTWLQPKVQGQ